MGLSTNDQCPPIVNAINDNGHGRESRAELGLGLGLALVDIGGNGSWWTMSRLCVLCVRFRLRALRVRDSPSLASLGSPLMEGAGFAGTGLCALCVLCV